MLDLTECLHHGLEQENNPDSPAGMYGWGLQAFDHKPRDWKEEKVHVSDYAVILPGDDGKCERQLFARINGWEKEPPSMGEKERWRHGNLVQQDTVYLIQKGLPDGYSFAHHELDVSFGLPNNDVGSCDMVIEDRQGRWIPVEMKSVRGNWFRYNDEPREKWNLQLQGYLYGINNHPEYPEAPYGIVFVRDREGQNSSTQFKTETNNTRIHKASRRANKIRKTAEEAKKWSPKAPRPLPVAFKRNENKGPDSIQIEVPWQCRYCSFIEECNPPGKDVIEDDRHGDYVAKITNDGDVEPYDDDVPEEMLASVSEFFNV